MGYSTNIKGSLKFAADPTREQLAYIKQFFGKDIRKLEPGREHEFYYIDLELTDDLLGIQWSGAEKTYGMVDMVNWLGGKMREKWPNFAFVGQLACQGEDADDRWKLVLREGFAVRVDDPPAGRKVECPECGHYFFVE